MSHSADSILEVKDLVTAFDTDAGRVTAVDGVSFTVPRGKTLGIVGESGCGKSVTAFSITRLLPQPHGKIVSGSIRFDGKELTSLPHDEMRKLRGKDISMIFQEPMTALNPVQTVGRQLGEAILLHAECSKSEVLSRCVDLMKKVRIPAPEQRLNEYPHQLSGGMRQRVMIAMALINTPRLLIADEPTTALDVTVQAQILDLIKDLQKDIGMSVILITHDLGVIAETCDEVAVMYGGRIVERAEVHQLFAHPRHAYTQGLLASIPKLESTPKSLLPAIPGNVPSIADFRSGCRFADRSGRLHTEAQLQTRAPMVELNPGHWVEDCGACVGIESTAVSLTPSHPNDHENDIHRLTPAQSSWQAALAYLGRSPRPGGPPQGRPERREERQRQLGILAEWAKDCGKLVAVSSLGTLMDQASEHQVYYDPAEGKAVKVTIPGRCGNTFPGGGFDAALPSEYCNRWLAYNEFFGDQVMFEGVALSGGEASLVVSQRWIKGDRPSSDDIFRFMAGLGMTQAPNLRDYYSISAGIAVLDAHLDNLIIDSEGDVVPIDVHVVPLDTNIRRALGV